jgi:hypothetical protein
MHLGHGAPTVVNSSQSSLPPVDKEDAVNILLDQRRAQGFGAPSEEVAERLAQLLAGSDSRQQAA